MISAQVAQRLAIIVSVHNYTKEGRAGAKMKKPILGKTIKRLCIRSVVIFAALVQCGGALPPANPVQSIDLFALDKILSANNFNGFAAVMASWCRPCQKELADLAGLYRKYHEKGIRIVAISIDADGPASVQPLVNRLKITFPVYWVGTKVIKQYKIVGVPTLMVVNRGTVLEKIPGRHRRSVLENKIKNLIKKETHP